MQHTEGLMKIKAIFSTILLLIIIGLTAKQDQVIASELKKVNAKTDYRDSRPASRAPKGVYVNYTGGGNRQNFETPGKNSSKNFKHISYIAVAAMGTYQELLFLHAERKPRVNVRNYKGETALIKVLDGSYNEDTFSKVKFLLSAGARPNVRGKSSKSDNTSPLGVAIWNSKTVLQSGTAEEVQIARKILGLLIAAGADASGLEANGRSLLHLAAETDNLFAAKLLLESGAKVIPLDDNQKTPLDIAESGEMIKLLKKHQVRKIS
jgi:hypothetical protein